MLTYERKDYETGTGIIQKSSFGKRYTVRELSKKSIEISDNVATNMLLRLLGMDNVKNYMRQLGGTVVVDDQNVTCPEDMGIYMREVYSFYKQDKTLGNELMGYFLNTTSSDRIPALLPKNVKIAHKIGNQVKTMNDVGIVFSREPYIISILSKDVNENEAVGVIAEISKKVYDFAK
jgi:beta-lactamase class A